jgi:LSD1 subclass zinc finger protein
MAVSKDLLDILVCPQCKTPVKLTPDDMGLKCATCHRVYPIRDDIPVMLLDEARVEND